MHIYLFFSQSNAGEALIDDLITTKRSLLSFSYSCFGKGNFPFSYSWATNLSSFCILISHIRVIQVVDMSDFIFQRYVCLRFSTLGSDIDRLYLVLKYLT